MSSDEFAILIPAAKDHAPGFAWMSRTYLNRRLYVTATFVSQGLSRPHQASQPSARLRVQSGKLLFVERFPSLMVINLVVELAADSPLLHPNLFYLTRVISSAASCFRYRRLVYWALAGSRQLVGVTLTSFNVNGLYQTTMKISKLKSYSRSYFILNNKLHSILIYRCAPMLYT